MSFVKLSEALKNSFSTRYLDDTSYSTYVLMVSEKILSNLFGTEIISANLKPHVFKNGILIFECSSSVIAHYYSQKSFEIMKKINQQLTQQKVVKIIFRQNPSGFSETP